MKLDKDVGIFDHFLSDDECDACINIIETTLSQGMGWTRKQQGELSVDKSDTHAFYSSSDFFPKKLQEFQTKFWGIAWKKYAENYGILNDNNHNWNGVKIQKTLPREGYHVWHYENSSFETSLRVLSFILYLNDDFDAGETEFLYKSLRVSPKKGTLAIFPANYTHTHRGNPPIGGTKYIMTGWVNRVA
jgi:hypothetical protein